MQLFYFENIDRSGNSLELSKDEARHLTRVLRKKTGDSLQFTDGKGNLYQGTITNVTSNKVGIDYAFAKAEQPLPYYLHIAIAPTKLNDRMEWFLEKATELGVSKITPLLCDHSERKKINHDRFSKVILSAMKQSLQTYLPKLESLTTYSEFINEHHGSDLYIAHCEEKEKTNLSSLITKQSKITILIGPEGDFSIKEIELAVTRGFRPVSLGNTRLRTETAGVYAAAVLNMINS